MCLSMRIIKMLWTSTVFAINDVLRTFLPFVMSGPEGDLKKRLQWRQIAVTKHSILSVVACQELLINNIIASNVNLLT